MEGVMWPMIGSGPISWPESLSPLCSPGRNQATEFLRHGREDALPVG
jgi:hypothetical protein